MRNSWHLDLLLLAATFLRQFSLQAITEEHFLPGIRVWCEEPNYSSSSSNTLSGYHLLNDYYTADPVLITIGLSFNPIYRLGN